MRLLLTFLFISSSLLAQDTSDIVVDLKNAEIERDFVLSDNEFKECETIVPKEQVDYSDKVDECVDGKVSELEDEQLEGFSKKYKIQAFNPSAAKTKKTLKDYLSERVRNAIYGANVTDETKLKDMKFVSQKQFFDLYKNQIGKNVLLEISRYALENYAPAKSFLKGYTITVNGKEELGGYNDKTFADYFKSAFKEEYACKGTTLSTTAKPCRNKDAVKANKTQQLALATDNPKKLGTHFSLMSGYIGHACESYRCNYIYSSLIDKKTKEKCFKIYGKDVGASKATKSHVTTVGIVGTTVRDKPGQIACSVENRLKSYRNTIIKVDEMIAKFESDPHKVKGFDKSMFFKGTFTAGKDGDKSLDEITSISSKELVTNVDSLNKESLAKEKERLEKECFTDGKLNVSNQDCVDTFKPNMTEEKMNKLISDEKSKTKIQLAYLDSIKKKAAEDREELSKFLNIHGLTKKYPDLSKVNVDEVIEIIKGKYAAERISIVENLKRKFEDQTAVKNDDAAAAISELASDQVKNIGAEAENIETLFNYSNIASSYLAVESTDKNTADTENTVMRAIEQQGMKEYSKDGDDNSQYDAYFEDVEDFSTDSGGADVDVNFLDQIIGNE